MKSSPSLRIGDEEHIHEELLIHQVELEVQNEQLRASEARTQMLLNKYRHVFHHSPIAYVVINNKGKIIDCNETLVQWTDSDFVQLKKSYIFSLFVGQDEKILRAMFRKIIRKPDETEIQLRLKSKDDKIILLQASGSAVYLETLDDDQLLLSMTDISEHVRVRSTLDLASHVLKNTSECVIVTDADAKILDVNPAFCKVTGYSLDEVMGCKPNILGSGKNSKRFYERMWHDINVYGHWRGRITNRKKDGEEYVGELAIHTVLEHNKPVYYIGIFYDVSERIKAEETMQRAQRLESIGTLTAGIAHNFNNILAGITGNLYLAKKNKSLDDRARQRLNKISDLSDSAAEMVKELLSFSRQSEKKKEVIEINSFMKLFDEKFCHNLPQSAHCTLQTEDTTALVLCDRLELEQALLNIVINAAHAVAGIECGKVSISVQSLVTTLDPHSGISDSYALISIQDNGCGIPEEIQDKVFEPFFTTKQEGLGTGLGLSTAYGSIAAIDGHINLMSSENQGTTFHIYLPLQEIDPAGDVEVPAAHETFDSNQGDLILLVDDHESVREINHEILEEHGFRTVLAQDGEEAWRLFREHAVGLVLTDVEMPKMGGVELTKRIHERNPEIPVIVMTGYSKDRIAELEGQSNIWFLDKPFDPFSAIALISKCLGYESQDPLTT